MKRRDFLKIVASYGTAAALGSASAQLTLSNTSQRGTIDAVPGGRPGSTTFRVQTKRGHWSVVSRSQRLSQISSQLNGQSVLLGSKGKDATFRKTIDRLEVMAEFAVVEDR